MGAYFFLGIEPGGLESAAEGDLPVIGNLTPLGPPLAEPGSLLEEDSGFVKEAPDFFMVCSLWL